MAHLIDKVALVAEIERLRKNQRLDDRHGQGVLDGLHAIERFIDALEAKEVDLKDEVERFAKECGYNSAATIDFQFAKHFFELGLKVAQKGE